MEDKKPIDLENRAILIDDSVLKCFFEGNKKNKSDKLMVMMKKLDDSGKKLNVFATLSSFLRAIWLADPKVKIGSIQKTLSFLTIIPSKADFKNGDAVILEVIKFAHMFAGKEMK